MNYRFLMVSDEAEDFRREFKISANDTFKSLHDVIIESVGFDGREMSSFIICDEKWNREVEISLENMDLGSDVDTIIMAETNLNEYLEEEKQKLIFVFDFLNERAFYLDLREISFDKDLEKPTCLKQEGTVPSQYIDYEDDLSIETLSQSTPMLDDNFYGDDMYNEDELDAEGFDGLDGLDDSINEQIEH